MAKYVPEIESGGLSVIGPVREDNQDTIHLPGGEYGPEMGLLYAVADGMGGYTHGSVASSLALETLVEVLFERDVANPKALLAGVEKANLEVYKAAQRLTAGRMGTTLTAAYVLGDMLYLAHVGDSRAYLIRDGRAICLTEDHSAVAEMVRSKLIPVDKIRTHAQRSILTKAVGLGMFLQPDLIQQKLLEGDRLVLCSDGVWSVIEDDDFARVAADASAEEISQRLVDLALLNKTDDNASVVVFHLKKLVPAPPERAPEKESGNWFQKLRKMVS